MTVELPDGQTLTASLHVRWQGQHGGWWYEVETAVWMPQHLPDRNEPEPFAVYCAPAEKVSPIKGVEYKDVPIHRHPDTNRRGRSRRDRPQSP